MFLLRERVVSEKIVPFLSSIQAKGWTLKSLAERWNLSERQMCRLTDTEDIRYMDAVKGLPMRVELKIAKHPSGRLTLMKKMPGEKCFCDCKDDGLFGCLDEGLFNKSASKFKYDLESDGYEVTLSKFRHIFIPMDHELTIKIHAWICRWLKNKSDDLALQHEIELETKKCIAAIGLEFNSEEFGELSFSNFQFMLGSDGIQVTENYFSKIPEDIKVIGF